jgi:hypothetical protein
MNDYGVDLTCIHDEEHADLARRAGPVKLIQAIFGTPGFAGGWS